jgi:anti-sigma factor ChrR (cupin superfamily)
MSKPREHDDLLLAALAGLLPEQEPAAVAKSRIRAEILSRVKQPGTIITRAGEGAWQALLPGVQVKTLRSNPVAGTQTTLWRLQPGARIPPHPHHHDEECLVLEGSIIQDGIEYLPGDYLLAQAGSTHASFESPRGALFLICGEALPVLSAPGTPAS